MGSSGLRVLCEHAVGHTELLMKGTRCFDDALAVP
jgi:hypothetical protein